MALEPSGELDGDVVRKAEERRQPFWSGGVKPVALLAPARGHLRLRCHGVGLIDVPVAVEVRSDGVLATGEETPSRLFAWPSLRSYALDDDSSTVTLYVGHYGDILVIDVASTRGPSDWITTFRAHGLRTIPLSDGWE